MHHFKVFNLNFATFYQQTLKLSIEYINPTGKKLFQLAIISVWLMFIFSEHIK